MMRIRNIEFCVFLTGLWTLAICGCSFSSTVAQEETDLAVQSKNSIDVASGKGNASLGIVPVVSDVPISMDSRSTKGADSRRISARTPSEPSNDMEAFPEFLTSIMDETNEDSERTSEPTDNLYDAKEPDYKPDANDWTTSASILAKDPSSWLKSDTGWFGRESLGTSLKTILVVSILTLAPAILLMTTSYARISIVLLLLRQALGVGQIPSNQIMTALSLFLTLLVMSPVGIDVYQKAVVPYSENQISREEAFQLGQEPIRTFLWEQIERTGNVESIGLFTRYLPDVEEPQYYEDVPWRALAPAFLLSELKTAFLIGFQIFLPFLVVDLIVSCVLVATGMMMLPPAIVSLPFKIALFVMVDGWSLVVKSLLESFV